MNKIVRERTDLLYTSDGHIGDFSLLSRFNEIVVNLQGRISALEMGHMNEGNQIIKEGINKKLTNLSSTKN